MTTLITRFKMHFSLAYKKVFPIIKSTLHCGWVQDIWNIVAHIRKLIAQLLSSKFVWGCKFNWCMHWFSSWWSFWRDTKGRLNKEWWTNECNKYSVQLFNCFFWQLHFLHHLLTWHVMFGDFVFNFVQNCVIVLFVVLFLHACQLLSAKTDFLDF